MLRFETTLSPDECRSRVIARAGRRRGIGPRVVGTCRSRQLKLRYRGRLRHAWAQTFSARITRKPGGSVIEGRFWDRFWIRILTPIAGAAAAALALAALGWSACRFWKAPSWFELFASVFLALWLAMFGAAARAGLRCGRRFGLRDRLEILRFLRTELRCRRVPVPPMNGGDKPPDSGS
ncbi:MAG TPA: hypothetical protein VNK41_07445 [Vicinamibacterales bacterium]|nr:hypothetical protein [Vicinamibacterales bacterium]